VESYTEEEVNMSGRFNRGVRLIGACFVMIGCMANPSSTQTPDSSSTTAVLVWTRNGGFAGFCDEMKISASGAITTSSCRPPGAGTARTLAGDDSTQFNRWRGSFGAVSIDSKDSSGADGMTITFTLQGTGRGQPTQSERQEMLNWAQRIYAQSRS
jgi:hypothetical protein